MAANIGFRIRLRVRLARALATEETTMKFVVENRDVTLTSQNGDEPLSKTDWVAFGARGFATEQEARDFGNRLCSVLQLAGLASRLGLDVGADEPFQGVTITIKLQRALADHERAAISKHGLTILPDDDNSVVINPLVGMPTTENPEHFASALRELGESGAPAAEVAVNGVRLLNLALMISEPLAKMALALSAVEELGQNQKWSEAQQALIRRLADTAEASEDLPGPERAEVAKSIREGLFPLSLRQGVMRLLSDLKLEQLRKEWDRLYGIRSGLFHGTARLPVHEINQAATDTVTLCGRVILAVVAKAGTQLPSVAGPNFNQKFINPPPIELAVEIG
jgi:hypothetical protein